MAFVTITFDDVERALSEEDARFLGEQLQTRRAPHSVAMKLADRIEHEARGATFADPGHDVVVDAAEKVELLEVIEAIDLDGQLTGEIRSLQMALLGERRPGEPASDAKHSHRR
jgi:hypothetical protein